MFLSQNNYAFADMSLPYIPQSLHSTAPPLKYIIVECRIFKKKQYRV
jgi:hypothetical protein